MNIVIQRSYKYMSTRDHYYDPAVSVMRAISQCCGEAWYIYIHVVEALQGLFSGISGGYSTVLCVCNPLSSLFGLIYHKSVVTMSLTVHPLRHHCICPSSNMPLLSLLCTDYMLDKLQEYDSYRKQPKQEKESFECNFSKVIK